jgi:hypothetical protein
MGRLYYAHADAITVPDETLAYVRAITTTKLRRSESFPISLHGGDADGSSTMWVHCSIPLRFEFDAAVVPALDRRRLEELAHAASSTAGLVIDLTETRQAPADIAVARGHLERVA